MCFSFSLTLLPTDALAPWVISPMGYMRAVIIIIKCHYSITNIIGCNDISDIMMATKNQNMHNTLHYYRL